MHGALQGGALTTTYTASQGLLLMIPNMYKMVGELLPGVMHVSARAVATHALSIFGDHQDVMATRQTGFALLASNSVQEIMDLGGIAHLAAIKSRIPFLHFFDGFRTSHEVKKVEVMDYEELRKLLDFEAIDKFRNNSLNPERPVLRGTAQNPDIYFQGREASNSFYEAVPDIVESYMVAINGITGREYHPFNYYGAKDADRVLIAMGSVCDTIEETIDALLAQGEKVGLIKVHLYRPFSPKYFFNVLPSTVKKIAVLDRTKEPGSIGEPLFLDIRSLFYDRIESPIIVGGRYGLGSNDTTPSQIMAVYKNLMLDAPKNNFTIGIIDDVTHLSLQNEACGDIAPEGTIQCKFWGLGSDGTVGANKMAIKIIGDQTSLYAQGYFAYDSKKSGGTTISYLRFGKEPIKSSYLVYNPGYIACHNKSYVNHYELLEGIKEYGTFVLNCPWTLSELEEKLPGSLKRAIAAKNVNFYIIDAVHLAKEIGLGGRINMIMQAVFFKLAQVIPIDEAVTYLKASIKKTYGQKGQKIIDMNKAAVDKGLEGIVKVEVPDSWINAEGGLFDDTSTLPDFVRNIQKPMTDLEGDALPVSTFKGIEDGTFPLGTTAYEKRGIAVTVPQWQIEKCIQCNQCAYICPHAVIRPFLLNENDKKKAPASFETKAAKGKELEGLEFRIQISPLDCTGCGNCADICPAPGKALVMLEAEEEIPKQLENWEFASGNVSYKDHLMSKKTVKGSQFAQPLLEFSGACAGCGETPYMKFVTQLFGDRMMVANATGCSSIWGASAPSVPYTTNAQGKGPAWANSLFEDNAEYGYGMMNGVSHIREKIKALMLKSIAQGSNAICKEAFQTWIEKMQEGEGSKIATEKVLAAIKNTGITDDPIYNEILQKKDFL
ncbi:MAG: pyruvate:ferredoxin (flavodoxin) oxidoreductase, partial [Vallitaleaceae bacterium]|nr:pyruvate:ferredoxin (flavodoxin) oxidoreductase [Vallitaleaceae bacterium]